MGRKSRHIRLQVILNGDRVGILAQDAMGSMEFVYAAEWLQSAQAIPVSQSLPLREAPYRGLPVESYFDNLLPDNEDIRRRIAAKMATESEDTLDLLAAIGRDCIGALQFVPEVEIPEKPGVIKAEPISDRDIANILRNLKTSPLGLNRETEFRISIAGAQEKTALLHWKGRWHRPKGMTPTTHILKPAMGLLPNGIDMQTSVQNEWLSLRIAGHFGLQVAKAEIGAFDDIECLVVERFDRKWSDSGRSVLRIPQEDLCQALGIPWSRKYESDGGPGIVTIMNFLNASDQREKDRSDFMRAQMVFFLLGAIDGHAKNFSITLLPTGFQLTPLYDIMTVLPALAARQIQPKQAKLAMAAGDKKHYRLGEIFPRHWLQTAKKVGFPSNDLHSIIQDLINRANQLDLIAKPWSKTVTPHLMEAVMTGLQKQVKTLAMI